MEFDTSVFFIRYYMNSGKEAHLVCTPVVVKKEKKKESPLLAYDLSENRSLIIHYNFIWIHDPMPRADLLP